MNRHFDFVLALLLLLFWIVDVVALKDGNFTTISDAIPQLTNLSLTPPRHPQLGTMNQTHCCLMALNSAFTVRNGYLVVVNDSFLSPGTTAESFLSAVNNGQFPCGASFNGNEEGAPLVKASYKWCSVNCAGWQRSETKNTQQWVAPLVSFILPCLVFSTTIPRRRKLKVSDMLFKPTLHDLFRFVLTPLRFLVAVIIVTVDILIWLALCFAFSGPMILSGVFEAFLDSRILDFVGHKGKKNLSKVMSTRLLYIILVGNLDFRWSNGKSNPLAYYCRPSSSFIDTEKNSEGDPWQDLEHLLQEPDQGVRLPSMVEVQNRCAMDSSRLTPVILFSY